MSGYGNGKGMSSGGGKGGFGGSQHSNVFVGNLPDDMAEDTLKMAFAAFGPVDSCHVMQKAGKTNGFVKMSSVDAAKAAIDSLSASSGWAVKFANHDIGGGPKWPSPWGYGYGGAWGGKGGWGGGWGGRSMWSCSRRDEPELEEPSASSNLYVRYLPGGIPEEEVKAAFDKVGPITELRLMKYDYALECTALVRYETEEHASVARKEMDDIIIDMTLPPLQAAKQQKKGEQVPDHVYIQGVPINTTKEKILEAFSSYGEVKWCTVLQPGAGVWRAGPTGGALVQMGTPEEADKAIAGLNGNTLPQSTLGMPIRVRFAKSTGKTAEQPPEQQAESTA